MNYNKTFSRQGFTLIETMVTVLILLIILASIFSIYTKGVLFWNRSQARSEVTESLRIGMDRLSRELRQAKELVEIGTNYILFKDSENRLITYFIYNQNQLNRRVSGNYNSMPIVNNVIGLDAYYNENQHLVTVTLTGRGKNTEPVRITTSICIRSLTDNF
ncbi:PilW family protein [Desulfolucanica intricata]|uniref:PilW family protein n=1 Tax=Desulfolucanica intricata TaxID=1285191 RepID=UPI000829DC38|nr:prepilin-type N-terminal cleavage/methylation domain-containing protein [Desulfolucanica intricata]